MSIFNNLSFSSTPLRRNHAHSVHIPTLSDTHYQNSPLCRSAALENSFKFSNYHSPSCCLEDDRLQEAIDAHLANRYVSIRNKNNKNKNKKVACRSRSDSLTVNVDDLDSFPSIVVKKPKNCLVGFFRKLFGKPTKEILEIQSSDYVVRERVADMLNRVSSDDNQYIVKLVEDVSILFYKILFKTNTYGDLALWWLDFIKMRTSGSLVLNAIDCFNSFVKNVFEIPDDIKNLNEHLFMSDGLEVHSFVDLVAEMRAKLDRYDELKSCVAFKKIYRLIMFAMVNSTFGFCGIKMDLSKYSFLERAALKKEYHLGPDFVHCIFDTFVFLCERGIQCYNSCSVQPIFHTGSKYAEFYDDCCKLKKQATQLSDPLANGFSESEYLANLNKAVVRAQAIYNHADIKGDFEKKMVKQTWDMLCMLQSDYARMRNARQPRRTPFSVLLFGDSSIGKSTLTNLIFSHVGKVLGLPVDPEYMYAKNPISKYWDGFMTSQWCINLDDISFLNPTAANGVDPTIGEVIQIVNPTPYTPDQAALEQKGANPLRAHLLIGSTNTEHLNAFSYFSCPSAVQRRFPYVIVVKLKPDYVGSNGMLDVGKIPPQTDDAYPDYWLFTVKSVVAQSVFERQRTTATFKVIHENIEMPAFITWLTKATKEHFRDQDNMMGAFSKIRAIKLCDKCFLPTAQCPCSAEAVVQPTNIQDSLEVQSMETIFYTMGALYFLSLLWEKFVKWYGSYRLLLWVWSTVENFRRECTGFYVRNVIRCAITAANTREEWIRLGNRVQNRLSFSKQHLMIFGAGLSLIMVTKKFYQVFRSLQMHGANHSKEVGVAPTVEYPETKNVWVKSEVNLTRFDVSDKTIGFNGLTEDSIREKLLRNCVFLLAEYVSPLDGVTRVREIRGFCVGGHKYLINAHFLKDMPQVFTLQVKAGVDTDGVNTNVEILFNMCKATIAENMDLAIIELNDIPPKRSYVELFHKSTYSGQFSGYYLRREKNGSENALYIQKLRQETIELSALGKTIPCWLGVSEVEPKQGDCGSLLISHTTMGPVILGIHIAGRPNCTGVVAHSVTYEMLKELLGESIIMQSGAPLDNPAGLERPIVDLHPKARIRFIPEGVGEIYGSMPCSRPSGKSRVGESPMAPLLKTKVSSVSYKVRYGAPVMNGWKPWDHALRPLADKNFLLDDGILDRCAEGYFCDIVDSLPRNWEKEVFVYDTFTAINGANGVKFVDKVNRSTSMGYPWNKCKKFFMHSIPPQNGLDDPVEFDQVVMDRVNEIIESYHNHKLVHPMFMGHLKDEARSFEKIAEGKTRVFTGAPIDFSLVTRMYYLPLVRLIQKNKYSFESAPGTASQTYEWHDMYEFLTEHGTTTIVAGDFKNFDKGMTSKLILKSFEVLIQLAKRAGYNEKDIAVMIGVAEDTAFALLNCDGEILRFYRGNPSGHPLTVIINCIANCLYMRYAYLVSNPEEEVMTFRKNVNLMTYGDDNIMNVSPSVPWFNHTAIAKVLSTVGIEYTMAEKTAASVPYIDIRDATFLKRSWRSHDTLPYQVCPLEEDSIIKMLMVWNYSKAVEEPEQGVSVISAAIREYFWYGEEKFSEQTKILKEIVEELKWQPWVTESTFPSYRELVSQYYQGSSGICTTLYGSLPNFQEHCSKTN